MSRITTIVFAILLAPTFSSAAVLYDGSAGGTPDTQGWNYLAEDPTGPDTNVQATHAESGGATTLDTTPDMEDRAGYFSEVPFLGIFKHPNLGSLDRTGDGFTLRLTAKIVSELHASIDRAGFSVIVLTSDNQGIELAFWDDTIWAQASGFTHAEEVSFATNAAMVIYDIAIKDDAYALYADDLPILSGSLREYSGHTNPVYSETDFIFFGDNTTSAQAETRISYIEVLDEAIPEPATLVLLTVGGAGFLVQHRRR
jgi:hypothetical protein